MKNIVLILFLLPFINNVYSQELPNCQVEHYGLANGLSQRSVMGIIQDKKGFMWFSTWDGLSKFDGHNFTSYKSNKKDNVMLKSNRIDKIAEDIFGYIWVHTYGRETFRFDPKKEKYVAAFQSENTPFMASDILPKPSGKVWLTSENMGVICVPDTTNMSIRFNVKNGLLKSNFIYSVYEDDNATPWILTENGLVKVERDNNTKIYFANEKDNDSKFKCVFETKTEIWFGTQKGIIWCYNKVENRFSSFDTNSESSIISIKKVYDNLVVVLTEKDGFMICNTNKSILKRISRKEMKGQPYDELVSCFIDRNNNVWFETNYSGVAKYDIVKNQLLHYRLENAQKIKDKFGPQFFIVEDKAGRIWVHPQGGGFSFYDKVNDKLIEVNNNPSFNNSRYIDRLHNIFLDKQGNLWLSSRREGIDKIVFDNEEFSKGSFEPDPFKSMENEIRAIFEDNDKNIWFGSKDGKVLVYNSNKQFKGYLCSDGSISPKGNTLYVAAYTFMQDKKQNIWIGSKGKGIFVISAKNNDRNKYSIKQYKNNPYDPYSLNSDIVYSIHEDINNNIWIGTYGEGINLFDKHKEQFINYSNNLTKYPINTGRQVRCINSYNNKVYVGTTLGLIVFSNNTKNLNNIEYRIYSKNLETPNKLKAIDIFDINITNDNQILIATFGGGFSKISKFDQKGFPAEFKTYDTMSGLHSDIVLSMTEDNDNNIWINSEGSLTKFNLRNESFEQFKDVNRVLRNEFFSEALPILTSNDEMITGTTKGVITFVPEAISQNNYKPYLALTHFNVANNSFVLKNQIDELSKVELKYDENIFSIEFSALDFTDPKSINYAYKLEGIDKFWIYSNNQRVVNYTKLPPGEYIFKVKSTNSDGTWVDNERSLAIIIKPSLWQTKWAYAIYLVLFWGILFIVLRSVFVFYRMKDRITLEQEQSEMRTRFFTDISHEIRTPLTMIVSPVENIINKEHSYNEIKPQLQLVLKNTNRMLNMVNQILDFRKIQKQKLALRETPIGEFVTDICHAFFKTESEQKFDISVNNQVGKSTIWIDRDGVEKLVFNLISNSVKYTDVGGKIEVNILKKDKGIALQVKDEGIGMDKETTNKLFTRFASFNTDKSKPSTGIGLSIVKEIADKHHAKIAVESSLGKGSCFTVVFQPGLEQYSEDKDIEIITEEVTKSKDNTNSIVETEINPKKIENDRLTLLVVEDDSDLRGFIKTVLLPYYNVLEADNGNSGYLIAAEHFPDFIISDVMMPELDGIEFLQKIRRNHETSHIPVILLTAKTNIEDRLEGINTGADDYITKPFNVILLKAKIDSIMKQRQRFFNFIKHKTPKNIILKDDENEEYKITSLDEEFLSTIQTEVELNLDNSDFTIDDLVAKTNISRRVFFNKLKSLTGLAPVEFVRDIRMEQAGALLKTQQYMVKEVVYLVGFSDVRYFRQCFKEKYGMTPIEYIEKWK